MRAPRPCAIPALKRRPAPAWRVLRPGQVLQEAVAAGPAPPAAGGGEAAVAPTPAPAVIAKTAPATKIARIRSPPPGWNESTEAASTRFCLILCRFHDRIGSSIDAHHARGDLAT